MTTLSDAINAYKICAKAENRSVHTIAWMCRVGGYFSEFLDDTSLEKIGANDLRRFIIALQQKQIFNNHQQKTLSPQSVKSYIRGIKAFFGYLEHEEFIHNNPMKKVRLPKAPQTVMPVFRERDLQKLLAQPDRKSNKGFRDYTIMLCLLDTAIRLSELCRLKIQDVDLTNGYLRIMGKGSKE